MSRPLVSVVVPAFNLADYLPAALDSALSQNDAGGPVEVIVIDDGSTDPTPDVLAGYGERIRTIRQQNRGLVASVDRGLREAEGEFIALLDADDVWPRDRLARHLAVMAARPEVGLTYGDMRVINEHGELLEHSFLRSRALEPHEGRILGPLVAGNWVGTSAITLRSSLLPAVSPLPSEAPYADWALAVSVAAVAEVGLVPGSSYDYRLREGNMLFGAGPERAAKLQRKEIPWRRWMLANLTADESVSLPELEAALRAFQLCLSASSVAEPGRMPWRPTGNGEARPAALPEPGPGAPRSRALLRSLAQDPLDGSLLTDLGLALLQERSFAPRTPPPAVSTLVARRNVTVAALDEIVGRPGLLHAFAAQTTGDLDASLVILASPESDLRALATLFQSDPALRSDELEAVVIATPVTPPAWAWIAARASSRLGLHGLDGPIGELALHPAGAMVLSGPAISSNKAGSARLLADC
jgi:hypothetical protein